MGKFTVNKKLWPMKGHYFLWNAGTAPVTPFLSVYAKQLGFSGFVVGIIYTIMPITGMFAKPIMGAIADKYRCQKKMFMTMIVITAIAFTCLQYVPKIDDGPNFKVRLYCEYGETAFDTCIGPSNMTNDQALTAIVNGLPGKTTQCRMACPLNTKQWDIVADGWGEEQFKGRESGVFNFTAHAPLEKVMQFNAPCVYFRIMNATLPSGRVQPPKCLGDNIIRTICDVSCDMHEVNALLPKPVLSDENVTSYYQFWLFLGLMIIAWIGQAVVVSVSDAICFELLADKPNKYGIQRSFGSLGWGVFSIIAGLVMDAMSSGEAEKNYTGVFYMSLAILVLDLLVASRLNYDQKKMSASILRDVTRLLANIRIFIFMLWCIFVGLCTGLIWNFLFWLLEELAGDNKEWMKTLEGLVMAIQCLGGELPFFFLSGWICKKLGHVHSMTLILLVIGIRYILYSILTNPWWVLPIELLNGITFGLFYACMASYASIVAPPGTSTTVQGLVGAAFEGIGVSIGSFLGGYFHDKYSASITFRIFGIASLIACLLHALVQYIVMRRSSNKDFRQYSSSRENFEIFADEQQELTLVEAY